MYEYEISVRVIPDYDITATDVSEIEMEVESGQLYPDYSGPYSVDAAMYDQTLETHYKNMTGDIVLNAVEEVNGVVTLPTADGEAKYIDINDKSGAIIQQYHEEEDYKVGITPIQTGTGDPSPSNIRPISGWTGAHIYRASKNLIAPYANAGTISAVAYEVHENGSIFVDGLSSSVFGIEFGNSHAVRYLPPGTYSYKLFGDNISGITIQGFFDGASAFSAAEGTFTIPENNQINYFRIRCARNIDYDNITVYPMIIAGSMPPTAWEACNSAIYTVSWQAEAGTVYGGTLDVTLGKLIVTHANIASYDGEELPGEWICDRAVYAPDTTPPTGSQVVYELATPLEHTLSSTEIQLLIGQNNVWADCGDITVTWGVQ